MNTARYRWGVLCVFLLLTFSCFAQHDRTPLAPWIFPGVSYQASQMVMLYAQYGENSYLNTKAVYLQGFVRSGKYITLNPAYLHLNTSGVNGNDRNDHTLMNAVIFNVSVRKILIEDRNLVWNWFRNYGEDFHFYRNRLRLTLPFKLGTGNCRVYVFDEASYFINRRRWSRNRLAVGFADDLVKWFNIDISFIRQHDRYSGKLNLIMVMGTIKLNHKMKVHSHQSRP